MPQKRLCVVCDQPLTSNMYTAMYCTPCRSAVAAITRNVRKQLVAAKLPPATNYDCQDCGKPAKEYDHRYYSLPLELDPVCVACNQRRGPARDIVELVRIERGMIEWQDDPQAHPNQPQATAAPLPQVLDDAERRFILQALERTRWNATAAAKTLGISFRAMRHRMKRLGVCRQR